MAQRMSIEDNMLVLREWEDILTRQRGHGSDIERDHGLADEALLTLLRELGHNTIADLFLAVDKWYA